MCVGWSWIQLESDPMQLLGRSGGKRATDELCVYPYPEINEQGEMELFFLSHGLRHLDQVSLQRIGRLHSGDPLAFRREDSNNHDHFDLALETEESTKVGYCPRYLNRDLCRIMEKTTVHLTVERLNHDASIQFRLLCKAVFALPLRFNLFADDEYLLLDKEVVAA